MTSHAPFDAARTALVIVDLQNDFLHPDGAYARGGLNNEDIAALPGRLKPLADAMRKRGGWVLSTHFTLVPGRGGEPIISPHLLQLRPFLRKGDFAPGTWGHALVDELAPADLSVEKVAYSAFYMTRLDWSLAQMRDRQADRWWHRHQWRRCLDRARCACARHRRDSSRRRMRDVLARDASCLDRGFEARGAHRHG